MMHLAPADGVAVANSSVTLPPEQLFSNAARTLAENGYLPIPVKPGDKVPAIKNWPLFRISEYNADCWPGHGVGLLCGELVGVDIDSFCPEASEKLENLAGKMLGENALLRFGRRPKRLLAYRTETPVKKRATGSYKLRSVFAGPPARVEVLGAGQQFVCFGIHPQTSRPYEWSMASPLDFPFNNLPLVTEAQIDGFVTAADALLAQLGARSERARTPAIQGGGGGCLTIPSTVRDERAWAESVLDAEADRVARAPEGTRNDTLNEAAFKIGTVTQWLDRSEVEGELLSAALAAGLDRDEAAATIRSGLDAGAANPRVKQEAPAVNIDAFLMRNARTAIVTEVPDDADGHVPDDDAHADADTDNPEHDSAANADPGTAADDPDQDDGPEDHCVPDGLAEQRVRARASALRAALNGKPRWAAVRRIKKNFPLLKDAAGDIVEKSYAKFDDDYTVGACHFTGVKRQQIVDIEWINRTPRRTHC